MVVPEHTLGPLTFLKSRAWLSVLWVGSEEVHQDLRDRNHVAPVLILMGLAFCFAHSVRVKTGFEIMAGSACHQPFAHQLWHLSVNSNSVTQTMLEPLSNLCPNTSTRNVTHWDSWRPTDTVSRLYK